MLNLSYREAIFGILVLALCMGCAAREAFVYDEHGFDRDAPTFGKKKTDISEVRVCYSKISATSKEISLLAEKECGKVNKYSRLIGHDTLFCPIFTPTGAQYVCESK